SLIASLQGAATRLAATATSAPCLSLFQPLDLSTASGLGLLGEPAQPPQRSLWWRFEAVHRRALVDAGFRAALRASRDALEPQLLAALQVPAPDWSALAGQGAAWHAQWQARANEREVTLPRWWRRRARL